MTGFARESAESAAGTMTWEVRTVNHRYLDIQFRLPDELRPAEADFKQQVAAILRRGKVECALHVRHSADSQSELKLDLDMIELLGTRISEIQNALPSTTTPSAIDVLRWPGVIAEPEVDAEPLGKEAAVLLDKALQSLAGMRQSEGERIGEMIASRCAEVASLAASVRERMPDVLEAAHAKQRERIERLDVEADPARLEVELALIAQKLDVDEELDRLDSHVAEIRAALDSDDAIGRRLDFLMQELNREANTLGSKSNDAQTSKAAVELKVLIEQMREQIQNLE
jgi:uncharacterized protein (TIGR00255 family)